MNCRIAPRRAHIHASGTPISSSPANQIKPTISASSVAALHQAINAPTAVFHISRELPRVGLSLVTVASASIHNFITTSLSYVFVFMQHRSSHIGTDVRRRYHPDRYRWHLMSLKRMLQSDCSFEMRNRYKRICATRHIQDRENTKM